MTEHEELSLVPAEARPYQGTTAGIATRVAANTIDGLVVAVALLGAYAGYLGAALRPGPARASRRPTTRCSCSSWRSRAAMVVYLTFAWWNGGRSLGERLMGLQVTSRGGASLGFVRSFARAVLCVVFSVGLLWCVVDPRRRSLQDIALRRPWSTTGCPAPEQSVSRSPPSRRPPGSGRSGTSGRGTWSAG